MAPKIYSGPIATEQERLLPGISTVAGSSLWIFPREWDFEAEDLQILADAFKPKKGVIWHASGVPLSKLRRYAHEQGKLGRGKPFPKYPMLGRNLIAQVTSEYLMIPGKAYSAVAWIGPEALSEIAELLGINSISGLAMAFVPDKEESAEDWANIVYGLAWLWHCQNWIAAEPQPRLQADAVLLSYIGLTSQIGGAAGLLAENLDAVEGDPKRALVFYAPPALLETVVERLRLQVGIVSELAFNRWLKRGAAFRASP